MSVNIAQSTKRGEHKEGESLQDYALLQTLGIKRESLSELHSFEDFPKSAAWINKTRKQLFSRKAGKIE